MRFRQPGSLARLLALGALALAACAAPAVVPPSPTPAPPPTATPLPITAAPAATSTPANPGPVPVTSFKFGMLSGLALDRADNLYVADCGASQIYEIARTGVPIVFAGAGGFGFAGDGGPATAALVNCPSGLAFDVAGNLYFADAVNNRIRKVDQQGVISTVAGSGQAHIGDFTGDGGPATSARLHTPTGIALDNAGNLYIADVVNNRVRKVDRQGVITTVAGSADLPGYSGDGGLATQAQLNNNRAVAVDAAGNLYIADTNNYRIRKVDRQGNITTVAGNGQGTSSGDGGPATAASLTEVVSLTLDGQGNLYFSEREAEGVDNNRVRKVDTNGIITTVAGRGEAGFAVDGGLATLAALWKPGAIAFDQMGNLYIADTGNARVRRVDLSGIITTVAGGKP